MRHRSNITKFSRDTKSRKALFKNLVRALVEQGKITTTEVKAKEIKRIADKLISKAKDNSLNTRRTLHRFFGMRDVVNTLVEKIAPEFTDRNSGFTRVTKIGVRRGDNTPMAELSLVKIPEKVGTLKKSTELVKKTVANKVTKKTIQKPVESKVAPRVTAEKKIVAKTATVVKQVHSKSTKKESK